MQMHIIYISLSLCWLFLSLRRSIPLTLWYGPFFKQKLRGDDAQAALRDMGIDSMSWDPSQISHYIFEVLPVYSLKNDRVLTFTYYTQINVSFNTNINHRWADVVPHPHRLGSPKLVLSSGPWPWPIACTAVQAALQGKESCQKMGLGWWKSNSEHASQ